jgi:putative membrane protein
MIEPVLRGTAKIDSSFPEYQSLGMDGRTEMGFHPMYGHYGAGGPLWSIISTALFIGLLVAAIMLLARMFSGPRQPGARPGFAGTSPAWPAPEAEGAERILAERYARGEISEQEYQGRLEVLKRAASG